MAATKNDKLHIVTPLIQSFVMGDIAKIPVFLKCDNCQPPGSFKVRGIGLMMQKCYDEGIRKVVIASGGNAGLAVAYCAYQLGMDATVVCPSHTCSEIRDAIQRLGANLLRHGSIWDETNKEALRISVDEERTFIHAFDHPTIWEGHASVIDEIKDQLQNQKPRCIIVAVGGGGYLAGVLESVAIREFRQTYTDLSQIDLSQAHGLKKHNWTDVPVVAVETVGTASLNESIKCGKHIIKENIYGIADCLKCKLVARRVFEAAVNKDYEIISVVVSDEEALDACFKFLDHHRYLVEPSCGAALTTVYSGIMSNLVAERRLPDAGPAIVLVCGGAGVSIEKLHAWKIELSHSTM